MEIVSEPDMNSSLEAVLFVKKLHLLLKHIGTCEGNLEMVCTMTN
jgi:aspartyl-tRNA(Asn)/glutamyl-tRNA(Gln) amidotransferase subunit B